MKTLSIFDIPIHCVSKREAYLQITTAITADRIYPYVVFTPNPEILVYGRTYPTYRACLQRADLLLPDGQGIVWASHGEIRERVTGSDMMLRLLNFANAQKLRVAFVLKPSGLSSAASVHEVMRLRYPNCTVTVVHDELPAGEYDLILVTLGFPEQEYWAKTMRPRLRGSKVIMTVGGAVDFFTGTQRRAPLFFRRLGLEWLWRVCRQPKRLKRIFTATILFPLYFMIDRYHHPNV